MRTPAPAARRPGSAPDPAVQPGRAVVEPRLDFELPPEREATRPPEHRGLARGDVRLLVARPGEVRHRRFPDLAEELEPGDLLVVNTSAVLPAALDAARPARRGRRVTVHVATELPDGQWVVEVRRRDATGPERDVSPGEPVETDAGVVLHVTGSYPEEGAAGSRLWRAVPRPATRLDDLLSRRGRPVAYGYVPDAYPLDAYQTVFADRPGSAEMPSAGRPFTADLLVRLAVRGVAIAPVTLHCGLSSPDAGEPPAPERYEVPAATARLVEDTRRAGGRVVAVGTTVVRALESAHAGGAVGAVAGWTDLVVDRRHPVQVVTGLVTGWHAPRASHLALLEAVAGPDVVEAAYAAALREGYLWHEFGDSALFLP